MNVKLGPYDQYLYATVVVVGTYIGVAILLWLTRRSVFAERLQAYQGIAHNFLTVINVLFALNLAFIGNDTWRAHDRALDAVYQEAGSLRSIVDLAQELPEPQRQAIDSSVATYAGQAVTVEWPLLGRRERSERVAAELDRLLEQIADRRVSTALAPGAHSLMLEQADHVRSTRDLRIALSQTHLNPLKWLGMAFLGFLTMISIAMVHVDRPRAQILAVLLFATAAAPSAAIVLIHGNPFQPPMAVTSEPISAVVEALR